MHRVSTAGFGWGYIGSVIPFLVVIALILHMQVPGRFAIPVQAARISFAVVALWWLLFSIPLLRNVHQIHFCPPSPRPVREAFQRLSATLRNVRQHRDAFLFLLAYFFFIDGIDTVTTMAVAYGVDIGLGAASLILAVLTIQVVAFPCALLWGRLTRRYAVKPLLQSGIAIYAVITVIAFMLPVLSSLTVRTGVFWLLSVLVATSLGGVQALSRSFFGRLVPAERSAEFFGFYNIFGKFAAISGPFLVGSIGQMFGHSRYGLLSILALLGIGSLILAQVRERIL
jgi:UMF1 family MFS transporter